MRLTGFRVQNYKRIEDTGWIAARDLTVLVGKNEAGKSAVLRGLSKLNPSDGERYDGLREFPRRRYSDEYDETQPAASARFEFSDDERSELGRICELLAEAHSVEIGRKYSNQLRVQFEPDPGSDLLPSESVRDAIQVAHDALQIAFAPNGHGDEWAPLKATILEQLNAQLISVDSSGSFSLPHIEAAVTTVTTPINEQWHSAVLTPIAIPLQGFLKEGRTRAALQQARNWVAETMPRFIYFDRYDVLDSAVNIAAFINQLDTEPHAPRVRTTRALFDHVDLDPRALHQLNNDPTQTDDELRRRADERAIRTSSAGQAMTEKFAVWWLQRRHVFRYQLDGNFFRVWVSDDLDPSEIELDQRSQGMQYFFSFFLIFLVEATGEHANSILLLDEPGTSLHGTAQAKIIEFLRSVSASNQVLYSTHSPFMIDAGHLEEVRPVWEDPETGSTKLSDDVWPKDKDALFPLQAALGYDLVQSLFISRHQILVEGITDFWIITALNAALLTTGRTGISPEVIVTPGGGAGRMVPLASMLVGHQVQVAALLDGDESGRREAKKLERILGFDNRTIFVGDHTPDGNTTGEIEDLFPDDYYLSAVRVAHGSHDYRFNTAEKGMPNIVDRFESLFARKELGDFQKWKVARALVYEILAEPTKVPSETLDAAEGLAELMNQITK